MNISEYFGGLEAVAKKEYELADKARALGFDPSTEVEVLPSKDLADRVEKLVGPEGCAPRIRELLKQYDREKTCLMIVKEIFEKEMSEHKDLEKVAEQCVRTGITILTEAVTVAGTEGISRIKIGKNADGSKYFTIYLTGPIRTAGGTAAAQTVILTDFVQKLAGLSRYVPTDSEAERYAEEVELYQATLYTRQYAMKAEEAKLIARQCPVCIDGEPTEDFEVSVYKNLPRVETDRVRGGMCLVLTEGFGLKAVKLLKFCRKQNLSGWDWLENLVKISKKTTIADEIKPLDKYLEDIVGGRPIFSYPSTAGGFRLRYGRCRNTGINAKAIHPAAMQILDEFPAVGTQFKMERPGKSAAIVPCDSIEPPVVLLKNGDVIRVDSRQKAREVLGETKEILSLGDILISIGDFTKTNHPFLPAGFCEEWWNQLAKAKKISVPEKISAEAALELCKQGLPLHPKYTHSYNNLTRDELFSLATWIRKADVEHIKDLEDEKTMRLILDVAPEKRLLEKACIPHKYREGRIIVEDGLPLLRTLERVDADTEAKTPVEIINQKAGFSVYDKAPTFIGTRMGRPEKARPRMMSPPPNGLFPVGEAGGKTRSVTKAGTEEEILVELPELVCPKCGKNLLAYKCAACGERAELYNVCQRCGRRTRQARCEFCKESALPHKKTVINFGQELKKAAARLGERSEVFGKAKGVIGTTNEKKIFEPLEKLLLRAKHGVSVFKDGTVRFDATNLPLTHFKPKEIGTSLEKLRALGYTTDFQGKPLTSEEQIIELRPQDIVPAEACGDYLLRAAKFTDDSLEKFYGLSRYYNAQSRQDLVGTLVIGLAPHISVGVLGRIIGYTKANATYAHPYFHCATRRDCFSYKETFPIFDGMKWKIVKIGEFIGGLIEKEKPEVYDSGDIVVEKKGFKTLSFNPDSKKYEIKSIVAFSKHAPHNPLVKIETKNGRTIKTTGTHQFLVSENGFFTKKSAHQLEEVLIPHKISIPERDVGKIDLLEINDKDLMIRGCSHLLKKAITENGGLKATSEKLKINKITLFDYVIRDSVPYLIFQKLNVKIQDNAHVGIRRDTVTLPRFIKMDEDFLGLIGFYIAEGYARKREKLNYQVVFCNKKYEGKISALIKKVFGVSVWKGAEEQVISSKLIYKLFTEVLGCGCNAKEKRAPPYTLSMPLEKVRYFLRGYFEGDGCVSKSIAEGASLEVACTSASELLLKDIEFLLLRFGIACSWQKDERTTSAGKVADFYKKKGKVLKWVCYKLRMYGENAKKYCEKIGFWDKNKKAKHLIKKSRFVKKRVEFGDAYLNKVKKIEFVHSPEPLYNLTVANHHNLVVSGITAKQCDGDENAVMLLLDALLNFSRHYMPNKRGASEDMPLVLRLSIDPTEIDDQVYAMETVAAYPTEFYEKTVSKTGADVEIEIVQKRLGKPEQYENLLFTHDTGCIDDGPKTSKYTQLATMREKVEQELELAEKLCAVDKKDMVTRLINFHFMRDIYGNLRAFGQQSFRCVDCNAKYRRIPLVGKCLKCGGKLLLTVNKGGIEKYLRLSKQLVEKYGLSDYLQQRLSLVEKDLTTIFQTKPEPQKQLGLADFV